MHSFGGIAFKDRRGVVVNASGLMDDDKQSWLSKKWHNLRFVLIDEIEAAGVDIVAQIEEKMRASVPMTVGVLEGLRGTQHSQRTRDQPFGGVKVLLFGDFWQLDPTGSKSFMSNPLEGSGDPRVDSMMHMLWLPRSLQDRAHLEAWAGESRVFELNTNIRSGEDKWWSGLLDDCRQGNLSEANYNFLHGLPTKEPITFWYEFRNTSIKPHELHACSVEKLCQPCIREKQRRNRLLQVEADPAGAAQKLAQPEFKNCVLITPFNKAVFQFAIHRAQSFADANGHQLFWMQAIDSPPAWFAGEMSKSELEHMKQNWLQYHAKKPKVFYRSVQVATTCPYVLPMATDTCAKNMEYTMALGVF